MKISILKHPYLIGHWDAILNAAETLSNYVYATAGTDGSQKSHYSSTVSESKKGHKVMDLGMKGTHLLMFLR